MPTYVKPAFSHYLAQIAGVHLIKRRPRSRKPRRGQPSDLPDRQLRLGRHRQVLRDSGHPAAQSATLSMLAHAAVSLLSVSTSRQRVTAASNYSRVSRPAGLHHSP
jgi:hypothetical protein